MAQPNRYLAVADFFLGNLAQLTKQDTSAAGDDCSASAYAVNDEHQNEVNS